jgi:hypothetical protein
VRSLTFCKRQHWITQVVEQALTEHHIVGCGTKMICPVNVADSELYSVDPKDTSGKLCGCWAFII